MTMPMSTLSGHHDVLLISRLLVYGAPTPWAVFCVRCGYANAMQH
jgi:hypothetical protein